MDVSKSLQLVSSTMKHMPWSKYCKIIGTATIVAFVWEHIGRKRNYNRRPSTGINYTAHKSMKCFRWIGHKFALLSSFLTQFNLEEIRLTMEAIFIPTFKLVVSPVYTISGYVSTAVSYNNQKSMVFLGSVMLAIGLAVGYHKMNWHNLKSLVNNPIKFPFLAKN